jgi:hypothetical protein
MDNITVNQIEKCKSLSLKLCYLVALSCLILFSSTAHVFAEEELQENIAPGSLIMLPFVKGDYTEQFRTKNFSPLVCPINEVCLDLDDGSESILFMKNLDKLLHSMLEKNLGRNILSMEETEAQYHMTPVDVTKDTTLSLAITVAKKMKSDYILVPILWDFSQRIGSPLAATEPASVSFSLYLISAKEEKRVWKDSFSKTQQSLSNNLFKAKDLFKMGGKWITAEELAQAGMHNMLENFPLKNALLK